MGKIILFPKSVDTQVGNYEFDEDLGYDVMEQMLRMDLEEEKQHNQ